MQFTVPNMTCGHCVKSITSAVHSVDSAAQVDIDLPARLVRIETKQPSAIVEDAIRAAGYETLASN
jgi:copper chaperone